RQYSAPPAGVTRPPAACGTSRRLAVHVLDQGLVLLVHELALQLHGGRELVVLGGELLLDQAEPLDRLDPREALVHLLDLRPDQVGDGTRTAERGEVREGNI